MLAQFAVLAFLAFALVARDSRPDFILWVACAVCASAML